MNIPKVDIARMKALDSKLLAAIGGHTLHEVFVCVAFILAEMEAKYAVDPEIFTDLIHEARMNKAMPLEQN